MRRRSRYHTLSPRTNSRIPKILMHRVNVKKELGRLKREAFKTRNGFELEQKKDWKAVVNADPAQILKEVFSAAGSSSSSGTGGDKENHESQIEVAVLDSPPTPAPPSIPEFQPSQKKEEKVNPLTGFPETFDVGLYEPEYDASTSGASHAPPSPPQPLPMSDFIRCSYCDKMDTKQRIWRHTIVDHSNK